MSMTDPFGKNPLCKPLHYRIDPTIKGFPYNKYCYTCTSAFFYSFTPFPQYCNFSSILHPLPSPLLHYCSTAGRCRSILLQYTTAVVSSATCQALHLVAGGGWGGL